ncbi:MULTISPECIES: RNA 2',3'-cyclic phosphodiesterase [unclassified Streptomyces]|uniref:RNA 2',3'-cyclic phosphodiesterase n=1 Tax=unclassified Streptomyces TaxID=2593676 RepID=UPI0006AFDAD5|nr:MULTISPECIES: RNA 2',3'-cyclic phosphodiesterase [unclassified Streptomyces]KOX21118.1 2'-5' RNA ligase [Streptomyces sp. NRRL F-6491]KOX41116.1 2'-5' RNA ligase [Streptomyces sp. NRRL F-6492]
MRLFAAVLPPPERLDELGHVVDRLRRLPGAEGVRWTSRPGWHLTLAFMGEVEDAALPELRARLERAASRTPPFSLRLHGGGHFGRRALWAGVAGDLDALRLLAERSEAAARRAGIAMEEHRRYRAHLTVGRGRGDGMDTGPFLDVLDGFEGGRWEVGELALVRSNLPVSGVRGEQPRYERAGGWPLGGGGDGPG